MTTDFERALRTLAEKQVEFIVVGGVAAALHGSVRTTVDLDVVYSRGAANIARLVDALAPHQVYPRGAPLGLPFIWDERTVSMGLNFTLDADFGPLDLLGEVAGGGNYENLLANSAEIDGFGLRFRVVDLDSLIVLKRAAGRPKDFEAIAELQGILTRRPTA